MFPSAPRNPAWLRSLEVAAASQFLEPQPREKIGASIPVVVASIHKADLPGGR